MSASISDGLDDTAGARVQSLTELASCALRAMTAPATRARGQLRPVSVAAALITGLGLFTLSWERFANLPVAGYNVKFPVLLFCVAALLTVPRWIGWLSAYRSHPVVVRWIVVLAAAAVFVFTARALTSLPLELGIAQVIAVGTGAVLPALAILGVVSGSVDAAWALRWFVAGSILSGVFGLYQLFAFYTGLPQGIAYTGVGTSGEGGRISAFSYEPAYFAYYLVLAIGAVLAIAHLSRRRVSWWAIVFFALVLVLANVRALLFLLPLFAAFLAMDWRRNRALLLRSAVVGAVLLAVVTAVPMAVAVAQRASQEASAPAIVPERTSAPAGPKSSAAASVPTTSPVQSAKPAPAAPQLPTDVLDPSEPSSNGPRLGLYKAVGEVDLEHLALGVGPGHLREALADNGYVAPNQGMNVVANNIWLQAVADGGVVLLLLEGALLSALAVLWWRARRTAAHPVASALIAVMIVGGMLTSYFFDIKVWVALALTVVLAVTAHETARESTAPE